MQSGSIENYIHLSNFKDIKDFNNNIEQWMLDVKANFTKSEIVALKRLIRFSAKVAGVCNAKIGTLVSATHKNGVGISRSTFKRMVIKAKEFGLLQVYETERKNGSQSANVYVFNRFESSSAACSEPPENEKLNHHKTSNLSKTNNHLKDLRNSDIKFSTIPETLDASFVSARVPRDFVNLVKYFFDDAWKIEEYWKLATISAFKNNVTENLLETAIQAFKTLVRKIKFSKVTNIYGFYWGILNRKFKAIYLKNLFDSWWNSETKCKKGKPS
ncbi:hypothetical protein AB1K84_15460 [Mesobacillus foraminis]|uniref:hypothetical protein n=1 Tax=Mesobacillus foraminis TaxID=279826 RepID=UPI0039A36CD8